MKKHSTIGCCGIDCGLCPRFHTSGESVCPGCDGPDFKIKHPSCGFITCCVNKKEQEVCSDCKDYPCHKFDSEKQGYDSFVTHRKIFSNLELLKNNGINSFIDQQNIRINILIEFLTHFDDNRSKSFFCLSCTLLPLEKLIEIQKFMFEQPASLNKIEKNKLLKAKLFTTAENLNIDLKLNKK